MGTRKEQINHLTTESASVLQNLKNSEDLLSKEGRNAAIANLSAETLASIDSITTSRVNAILTADR